MQRKRNSEREDIVDKRIDDLIQNQKNKSRISSLTPYIAEIERRKKMRDLAKQSKKNLHQSSSKSFRIKQNSLTLLQKETLSKTKNNSNGVISKLVQQRAHRQQRAKSLQKHYDFQSSKTLQNRPKGSPQHSSNKFFNDLYVKIKRKVEKEGFSRKKKYQTIDGLRARSTQTRDLSIKNKNSEGKTVDCKKQEDKKKDRGKNFRRNKFEIESQPTLKFQRVEQIQEEKDHMIKKQSNASINKEMDKLAQRQMECFYKHTKNRQFHRSVEHSTEQYFNSESYRPAKSKNDIEVFLSIAKMPAVQKVSQSTQDNSKANTRKINSYLYDFSFPDESSQNGMF